MIVTRRQWGLAQPISLLAASLALVSLPALAQQPRLYQVGGGFLGGVTVEASAIQVENFFYEDSESVSANGYRVRPSASLTRTDSIGSLRLDGYGEYSDYDLRGSLDSNFDYGASARYDWRPLTKHSFDLAGGYQRGHDPAGLVRTEEGRPLFDQGEVDEWDQTRLSLTYGYGSPSSLARNELSVGVRNREYVTNRDATRFLNYDTLQLGYLLSYAYSPKTAFLFVLNNNAIDYEIPVRASGNRNLNELAVRTGVRWVATAKTSGDVQVGVRSVSLDGRARPSRQAFAWRANLEWVPTARSTLRLSTGESTSETYRNDTLYIDNKSYSLSWRQSWTSRLDTSVSTSYVESEFVGSGRKDETVNANLGIDYQVLTPLTLFADLSSRNRESTFNGLDYDAPQVRLGVRWTP
ncbi:outer membrane beta-barrel protein [Stagnimonas aquatica]|uniref:outer membrane beta-barrel protein n=1 Tax=Stagnimonas aquatica TaxID=2689987 RepID=UPI001315188C|nr:outer membrane beta-barrel protein [Stagnimonas aquatica]